MARRSLTPYLLVLAIAVALSPVHTIPIGAAQDMGIVGLLPEGDEVAAGLVATDEGGRSREEIAAGFPDPTDAAERLDAWGWAENTFRTYAPAVGQAARGLATVEVSINRFTLVAGAAEALPYFARARAEVVGLAEVAVPPVGDRATVAGPVAGGFDATVYAQEGTLLIRVTAVSADANPIRTARRVAEAVVEVSGGAQVAPDPSPTRRPVVPTRTPVPAPPPPTPTPAIPSQATTGDLSGLLRPLVTDDADELCDTAAVYFSNNRMSTDATAYLTGCRLATDSTWFVPSGASDPRLLAPPPLDDAGMSRTLPLRQAVVAELRELDAMLAGTLFDETTGLTLRDGLERTQRWNKIPGDWMFVGRPYYGPLSISRHSYEPALNLFLLDPNNAPLATYVQWWTRRRAVEPMQLAQISVSIAATNVTATVTRPPWPWELADEVTLEEFLAWAIANGY